MHLIADFLMVAFEIGLIDVYSLFSRPVMEKFRDR